MQPTVQNFDCRAKFCHGELADVLMVGADIVSQLHPSASISDVTLSFDNLNKWTFAIYYNEGY